MLSGSFLPIEIFVLINPLHNRVLGLPHIEGIAIRTLKKIYYIGTLTAYISHDNERIVSDCVYELARFIENRAIGALARRFADRSVFFLFG